jgi:cytochrome c peroxidase
MPKLTFLRAALLAAPALLLALSGCGSALDSKLCETAGCDFSRAEWQRLQSLANLPDPPPDRSNKYVGNAAAEKLGQQFYFDARFSGGATMLDMLRRPVQYARAAKDQPINISCATCHTPARGGADFSSLPGHVSVGAGWYDVNGQPTVNAAYYDLIYWNGRIDSLWGQIVAVNESFVSMNGNRLKNAWVIGDKYRDAYNAVFTDHPLPLPNVSSDSVQSLIETSGSKQWQCKLDNGSCPTSSGCREVTANSVTSCWPRFPLQGKPGSKAGCQAGDSTEPFNDAFDCMADADRSAITRVHVNFAKAIASYEYKLISRDSPFDRFVNDGGDSDAISAAAKRGAKLFVGKAACIDCHNTPLFSDNQFYNIGVPQSGAAVPTEADCPKGSTVCDCDKGVNCLPWGAWDGFGKLKASGFTRRSVWSDDPSDTSRQSYSDTVLTDALKGAWRTPSLRNVELTAPYMHNGLLQTLEDVVWHYSIGAAPAGVPGKPTVRLHPLDLTTQEQNDLVAFLRALTGAPLSAELTTSPTLP